MLAPRWRCTRVRAAGLRDGVGRGAVLLCGLWLERSVRLNTSARAALALTRPHRCRLEASMALSLHCWTSCHSYGLCGICCLRRSCTPAFHAA